MGQRTRARECALQMLYQIDLTGGNPDEVFPAFWGRQEAPAEQMRFAETLVKGVLDGREILDTWLREAASNWRLERMAVVDRNLLRLAVHELLAYPETPPAVVIDEAIKIAKKFGNNQSGSFVNGVLDTVRKRIESRLAPSTPLEGE